MISPDELQALDLLIWLRTGKLAGHHLGCNQSTISRRVEQVQRVLQVDLKRVRGEWWVHGNTLLLELERQVHQLYRCLGRAPLRLEAGFPVSSRLLHPAPHGWITGLHDEIGPRRSLRLLRYRIIDAWLATSVDELPADVMEEFAVFDLYRAPVHLMAAADHPLASERGLTQADLERFPSVALPQGWYPRTADHLRSQGLWNMPERAGRYDESSWEARLSEDLTLFYATPHLRERGPHLVPLDWDLGLHAVESLVVHQTLLEQPAIAHLVEEIRRRARVEASLFPELELLQA
jgi:hypothetical protein